MFEKEAAQLVLKKHQVLGIRKDVVPKVSHLGAGENNLNLLVDVSGKKFVFRIGMRERLESNMLREFRGLQLLPKNVGPKPLLFDNSKKDIPHVYSVLSYLEGEKKVHWTKRELLLHAKKLAFLHKKSFSYRGNLVRKYPRLDLYQKFMRQSRDTGDALLDREVQLLLPCVKKYIRQEGACINCLRHFSLIHSDVCVDNIIFSRDDVHYIDWEWMKIGDPARDVARFWYEDFSLPPWAIRLSRNDLRFFIKEYQKHRPDATLEARVIVWNTYSLFMDMLYNLWKKNHYAEEKIGQSKKLYADAVRVMLASLKRKFP
jgi:thiamine kinase-like enzyme